MEDLKTNALLLEMDPGQYPMMLRFTKMSPKLVIEALGELRCPFEYTVADILGFTDDQG